LLNSIRRLPIESVTCITEPVKDPIERMLQMTPPDSMSTDPASKDARRENADLTAVGVVVIGRNEGERLRRCLDSVRRATPRVVYVDSGSSDGSVAMSRGLGVTVVELDLSTPFTAARARNAGFERLLQERPTPEYVFFVDGDCEVIDGWLDKARRFLDEHPDVAVVCGRRREKYPQKSLYNMLCDIEWDLPLGETPFCGGDAFVRVHAFQQINGFRPDLICGEEPEMCTRLRKTGSRIWRLPEEMTLHDAAMYRFGQWWIRMVRGGYAFAQGAALHGAPPERLWVSESRRVWIWGLCIPLVVLALTFVIGWPALLLLAAYPINLVRLALRGTRSRRENWWRAATLVLCKFPEVLGQMKFWWIRYRRVPARLIEYK
jgi:GT2 family glycosyltransferase